MADKLSNRLAKADELANGLTSDLANDNEIIRGLERMSEEDPDGFSSDLLNLINRQKAEIERLKSMNQSKLDIIHDVRADLETAKSEAIREFAERLKNKSQLVAPSVYAEPFRAVSVEEIDRLANWKRRRATDEE